MDLLKYSEKIARENLPERFVSYLCKMLRQMDNISVDYQKRGNNIYLAISFYFCGLTPQEFFWLDINLYHHKGKEIEVIWNKFLPSHKISLRCCGFLQRAIINYVSLRRGELLALLCYRKFATITK